MPYRIESYPAATKALKRVHPMMHRRIAAAIRSLADDPRPHGCKSMQGQFGGMLRIRVGDHRVVYSVDDARQIVTILDVGPRGDIYK